MRLLVVDGDPQARGALKARLLAAGIDVVDTAEDVDGALAQLQVIPSDAVLLGKPRGGALLSACARLRAEPVLRGRPILLLGASSLRARGLAAGAAAVVARDLEPRALGEAIAEVVAEIRSHARIRLGLVAPREARESLARALVGAGYEVETLDTWPAGGTPPWSLAVAAEPPPAGIRAPIVPLWRGTWRGSPERYRPLPEVLESVGLFARSLPEEATAADASIAHRPQPVPEPAAPEERLLESVARARVQLEGLEETTRRLAAAPAELDIREDLATQAYLLASSAAGRGLHEAARLAGSVEAWGRRYAALAQEVEPSALVELADWLIELEAALRAPVAPIQAPYPAALLLVDDEGLAERLEAVARELGAPCRRVHTVPELGAVATRDPPDAIVVSASMLADVGAARELRLVAALAEVPVVLLCAPGDAAERLTAVRLGGARVFEQPAAAEEIVRYLRGLVEPGTGAREPRVVVLGDDALRAKLRALGFDAVATDASEDAIAAEEPDAVVIAERAAETEPLLRRLRLDPRLRSVPALVLCAASDDVSRVRLLEAGAEDAMPPGGGDAEVAARLKLRIERATLVRSQASQDPATGLATRRRFEERLEDELAIAERSHRPFVVVSLEADGVEGHGERARRALMAMMAKALRDRLRRSDLVARAKDEFLVLLRECTCDDAQRVIEAVLRSLPQRGILGVVGAPTFSAGIASYPDHGREPQLLLGAARRARLELRRTGATATARVAEAQGSGVHAGMRAARVLLVDPDETVRRLVGFALEKRGYVVEYAVAGDEAVHRLLETPGKLPPDLVLLDIHVPFVDGFEILRRLKQSRIQPRPKVIVLTGRTSDADIVHAFELGAVDHVSKPFSVPILLARVRAALARGKP